MEDIRTLLRISEPLCLESMLVSRLDNSKLEITLYFIAEDSDQLMDCLAKLASSLTRFRWAVKAFGWDEDNRPYIKCHFKAF